MRFYKIKELIKDYPEVEFFGQFLKEVKIDMSSVAFENAGLHIIVPMPAKWLVETLAYCKLLGIAFVPVSYAGAAEFDEFGHKIYVARISRVEGEPFALSQIDS